MKKKTAMFAAGSLALLYASADYASDRWLTCEFLNAVPEQLMPEGGLSDYKNFYDCDLLHE